MAKGEVRRRWLGSAVVAVGCVAVMLAVAWSLFGRRPDAGATAMIDQTASLAAVARMTGPSGLPLPRFVSLKTERVNVRRGPSSDHKVAWVFQRKGLPVEIVAEFENWRRIRDSDGEEGWILQNMLSGRRTAMIAPWRSGQSVTLYRDQNLTSEPVARLSAGVVADVESCSGEWCRVVAAGFSGYIEQAMLWGVYPGETVN